MRCKKKDPRRKNEGMQACSTCNTYYPAGNAHSCEGGCSSQHRSRTPLAIVTTSENQTVTLDTTAAKNFYVEVEHAAVTLTFANVTKPGRKGMIVVRNDRNDGSACAIHSGNSDAIVMGTNVFPYTLPNLKHLLIEYYTNGPNSIVPVLVLTEQAP
jgi:hypothetical protein